MTQVLPKSTTAKVVAVLAGVAFVASLAFGAAIAPANAQSSDASLQAQISSLLETIAQLQTQLNGTQSNSNLPTSCVFLRDLGVKATGEDVVRLQQFLNSDVQTQVAISGAGSPGMETSYYGALTAAAVNKFQTKYSSNILAPLGLVRPTGYFGAGSRQQARVVCDSSVVTPTPGNNNNDGDNNSSSSDETLNGGEADISGYRLLSSPNGENVAQNDTNVKVLGAEFDVNDADVSLRRVDVRVEATDSSKEDKPWRLIDSATLYSGSTKIATVDTNSKDDWTENDSTFGSSATSAYEIRFSNVDTKYTEGTDNARLYVAFTMANVIDSNDEGQTYRVWIPNNGLRFLDGSGINHYQGNSNDYKTFDLDSADNSDINISKDDNNPDAQTAVVNENDQSDETTVLVFDMKVKDEDATLDQLILNATTTASDLGNVFNKVTLSYDGGDYDGEVTSNGNATGTIKFDNLDLTLDAGKTAVFTVTTRFNKQDGNYSNGDTVVTGVNEYGLDVDSVNGENPSVSGSAESETITLLTSGLAFDGVSTDAYTQASAFSGDHAKGQYTIKFKVTAVNDDAYIPVTSARNSNSASTTAGAVFDVLDGDSGAYSAGTSTASLQSTASKVSNRYKVSEGSTETFTLKVTVDPAATDYYSVVLNSLKFATTSTGSVNTTVNAPTNSNEFETDQTQVDA